MLKKYMFFIMVLTAISIVLSLSYSNFKVTSENHKVAEMYIGTLKYSMTIDGTTTNTLSVPSGETIVDIIITNENPIDTYYKLIYQNNSNITITYYGSTKDTEDNVTNYSSPNDKITSKNTNTIKLKIINNNTLSQDITFKIVGGFATNTLDDITVPSVYTIINSIETPSSNTYYCTTTDTLTSGLKYVNGQYTYAYRQQGKYVSSGIAWSNITNNGWGVQLTDKTSTDAVTSKICTYINNKPITSMSYMFFKSQATTLDLSNFDTSNVTNMNEMFADAQNLKTIYISDKFNTDKVTYSTNMFTNSTCLVGGAGTKYNSSYVDKTYAHIDGGTSNPGYFTDIADKPSTFPTDSWKTIAASVKAGNSRGYKVGETKTIDMGTYGTHTLRIANTSTPSECSTTGFSQTACGFVIEFANIITTHVMNEYETNEGGWPASEMHTFVNNDIYNALPSELRNVIIDTATVSGHGATKNGEENYTSTDKLYLLSTTEIRMQESTDTIDYDTARDLTRTLDYYKNKGVTTSNHSGAIKNNGSSAANWWLRTAGFNWINIGFYSVKIDGDLNDSSSSSILGVSPAFRIG